MKNIALQCCIVKLSCTIMKELNIITHFTTTVSILKVAYYFDRYMINYVITFRIDWKHQKNVWMNSAELFEIINCSGIAEFSFLSVGSSKYLAQARRCPFSCPTVCSDRHSFSTISRWIWNSTLSTDSNRHSNWPRSDLLAEPLALLQ